MAGLEQAVAAVRPGTDGEIGLTTGRSQGAVIAQKLGQHEIIPAAEQVIRRRYIGDAWLKSSAAHQGRPAAVCSSQSRQKGIGLADEDCVGFAERQMPCGSFQAARPH